MAKKFGKTIYHISGFTQCSYFTRAKSLGADLKLHNPKLYDVKIIEYKTRDEYKFKLNDLRKPFSEGPALTHTSSPFVWKSTKGKDTFIGGCDDFQVIHKNKTSFL